jgi:hypothetical protein
MKHHVSISKGSSDGSQKFTGGSGKFSGIQGSNLFECQLDRGSGACHAFFYAIGTNIGGVAGPWLFRQLRQFGDLTKP